MRTMSGEEPAMPLTAPALVFSRFLYRLNCRRSVARASLLTGILIASALVGLSAQRPTRTLAGNPPGAIADTSLDTRVESILQSMTLDEKVGQLVQYSAGQATGPGTGRTDY